MARILIADVDPDICSFLCRIVRKIAPDVQIDTAEDGEECLEKLCSTPFDLALLDVEIPRLSGLDVMYTVRRKGLGVDIVLLSGWATAEMARRAARAGAKDLLEKPILVHEIMGTVHHLLDKVGIPVGKG
jgi:DNA-binding response OmpR family regulator